MATPTKWGTEFLVNSIADGVQYQPVISKLADGRFVATWTDDPSGVLGDHDQSTHAQIFNADGSKSGTEFQVNIPTQSDQSLSAITSLSDGRFVAIWMSEAADTDVLAQIFNADGSKFGAEFVINTTTAQDQVFPKVTTLYNGRFVATWQDGSGGLNNFDIRAQVFDPDGTKFGAEFVVNTTTTYNQYSPSIAALDTGRFVVAWTDNSNLAEHDVRAQVFNPDGAKIGPEVVVNPVNGHGNFEAAVTGLNTSGGRYVVAWTENIGLSEEINAQIFNGDSSKGSALIHVNTTIAGDQSAPTIATLADGRFVVAWTDSSGTDSNVRAQVFDSFSGAKSGSEFVVNTTMANFQVTPTITVLADGRFAVGWTDYSGASGEQGHGDVRGQIFDPRESGVSLTGTVLNDDNVGTKFDDAMAGGPGNDHLVAAAGNDTLKGGGGADFLDGGADIDTAVFSGLRSDYRIDQLANGDLRVVDLRPGSPDGIDTVRDIEKFTFSDGTFAAVATNHAPVITSDGGGDNAIVSMPENSTMVTTVTATDIEPGTMLAYSIIGGADAAKFHIDAATGALSFNSAPNFEAPADADGNNSYLVQVHVSDGGLSDDQAIIVNVLNVAEQVAPSAHNDFNGDGHSDILWQNADGTPMVWSMDGLNATSMAVAGFNPGAAWHVIGSGDFNGDGKADILWQNADGTPAAWLMNGPNILSGANVGFNPGADWHEIAAADFNGDGKADILWQNTDGQAAIWQMDGLSVTAGSNVGPNVGAAWHVIDTGDFDGDGKADILWQNDSGQAAVWLMDGFNVKSGSDVGFNPGAAWHVQGAGDFNGDGKADILWQNADGTPAVWLMDGTSLISGANVGFNPGPAWQVHGTGDFNGDGKADIEWQNTDGTPAVWLMDGYNVVSGANAGADPGADWHVIPQHHDLV